MKAASVRQHEDTSGRARVSRRKGKKDFGRENGESRGAWPQEQCQARRKEKERGRVVGRQRDLKKMEKEEDKRRWEEEQWLRVCSDRSEKGR